MASEVPIQPQLPRETRRDVSLATFQVRVCGIFGTPSDPAPPALDPRPLPGTPRRPVVTGTSSWVSPTLQDASSWTCLPVVPCLHHGRVQAAAHPQEDKGPVGQSHPKGHAKTRECRCVWGLCRPWPWGVGLWYKTQMNGPVAGLRTAGAPSSPCPLSPLGSSQGKGPHLSVRVTRRGRGLRGGACRASGPHQVLAPQWLCSLFSSCLGRQVKGQGRGWRGPGSGELAAGAKVPVPLGPGRVLSSG